MNTAIGRDAAKLLSLEIDMLQKLRSGQLTLRHIEWWQSLTKEERDRLVGPSLQDSRFTLIRTFDVTVPEGYVHETRLASFKKENGKNFNFLHSGITDVNFRNAARLVSGRTFKVEIFGQNVSGMTSSDERMALLRSKRAVFVGAQGASLVVSEKREELPRGFSYASFDERDALWKDADGFHRLPIVNVSISGDIDFDLGIFEKPWSSQVCFLCFTDKE